MLFFPGTITGECRFHCIDTYSFRLFDYKFLIQFPLPAGLTRPLNMLGTVSPCLYQEQYVRVYFTRCIDVRNGSVPSIHFK
jgi:hypothetical protein